MNITHAQRFERSSINLAYAFRIPSDQAIILTIFALSLSRSGVYTIANVPATTMGRACQQYHSQFATRTHSIEVSVRKECRLPVPPAPLGRNFNIDRFYTLQIQYNSHMIVSNVVWSPPHSCFTYYDGRRSSPTIRSANYSPRIDTRGERFPSSSITHTRVAYLLSIPLTHYM